MDWPAVNSWCGQGRFVLNCGTFRMDPAPGAGQGIPTADGACQSKGSSWEAAGFLPALSTTSAHHPRGMIPLELLKELMVLGTTSGSSGNRGGGGRAAGWSQEHR